MHPRAQHSAMFAGFSSLSCCCIDIFPVAKSIPHFQHFWKVGLFFSLQLGHTLDSLILTPVFLFGCARSLAERGNVGNKAFVACNGYFVRHCKVRAGFLTLFLAIPLFLTCEPVFRCTARTFGHEKPEFHQVNEILAGGFVGTTV